MKSKVGYIILQAMQIRISKMFVIYRLSCALGAKYQKIKEIRHVFVLSLLFYKLILVLISNTGLSSI